MSDESHSSSKNDLAQRLREAGTGYGAGGESLWFKAADEIERLTRELHEAKDDHLLALSEAVESDETANRLARENEELRRKLSELA